MAAHEKEASPRACTAGLGEGDRLGRPITSEDSDDIAQRQVVRALPLVVAYLTKNQRETVRIALDEFRGVRLIDMRVMAPLGDPGGTLVPTKKGLCLRVDLLPELLEAIQKAEQEARRLGLLASLVRENWSARSGLPRLANRS
jgi:transcriptional coactivator p15 (PC4)